MAEVLLPTEIISKSNTMIDENETDSVKPAYKASTIQAWQRFMDFLLRHLAQISMKYTDWEATEYAFFCEALDFSEQIDGAALSLADLKKRAKLLSDEKVKVEKANSDKYGNLLPDVEDDIPDPKAILTYLDLLARLKEVSTVAGDLQKSLKKADVPNLEEQAKIQKFWKAMTLPRIDLSAMTMQDSTAGPRAIWSALSRTIFHLSFQFLQKASQSSGVHLKHDTDLVKFNLTDEELAYAQRIVDEVNKQIKSQAAPDPRASLAAKLAGLGSKNNSEAPIIGMQEEMGIILPPDIPKEPPLKKKGKKKGSKSRPKSAMVKGHHRKVR